MFTTPCRIAHRWWIPRPLVQDVRRRGSGRGPGGARRGLRAPAPREGNSVVAFWRLESCAGSSWRPSRIQCGYLQGWWSTECLQACWSTRPASARDPSPTSGERGWTGSAWPGGRWAMRTSRQKGWSCYQINGLESGHNGLAALKRTVSRCLPYSSKTKNLPIT